METTTVYSFIWDTQADVLPADVMWWVNPSLGPSGFLLSILLLPTKDHFAIIRVHPFFLSKSQQMMEKYVPDALEWKLKSIFLYHPSYTFWLYWCAVSVSLHTQSCLPLWDPMDCNPQVPLSVGFFFSGKNTRMGCHFLLQEVFPTQGSNPGLLYLLYGRVDSLPLSHLKSQYYILNMLWGLPLWSSGRLFSSTAGGSDLIPDQVTDIPHAMQHGQKKCYVLNWFSLLCPGNLTPIYMEYTLPVLNKSLTKELLDHYLSLNLGLATLGDKVNVHF